jgi:hypothetical protein
MLRNSIMQKTWKIWALCLAIFSIVTTRADSDKSVTAAQVNGTWKTNSGEFKIWALSTASSDRIFWGLRIQNTMVQVRTKAKAAASRRLRAIPLSSNPRAQKRNAKSL